MNPPEIPLILLVEDEPAHAEIARRSLASLAFLEHVPDGEAALAWLRRPGAPRPALVLLDLRLPRMDGLEVLAAMKSDPALARLPVIVMSTSAAERDLARAYDRHANAYLVKPLDFARFMAQLRSLAEFWLKWNHRPS